MRHDFEAVFQELVVRFVTANFGYVDVGGGFEFEVVGFYIFERGV